MGTDWVQMVGTDQKVGTDQGQGTDYSTIVP